MRRMPANAPSLPPNYSGSPVFGAPHGTQQIPPTSQPVSDREPSGSRLPPVPNLNLIGRSTGEQAVIVALQAVANYPNSSDFVRAVEQRIPGLANYLQAAAQPLGCETPTALAETASMDTETIAGPSSSTTAAPSGSTATGPREEAGRKRVTGESGASAPIGSLTESPTSRPPPDKRADVPQQPQMKSVVIVRSPYRIGHLGRGAPQLTMREAIGQYGDAEVGPGVSSVPSGTSSAEMSLDVPQKRFRNTARQPSYHHPTMCLAP